MSNEVKKVFFIVNRYSGTGYKPEHEKMIKDTCRDNDVRGAIEFTQGPGHATALAKQAMDAGFQKVVAVGGDGTVNEVAQALLNSPILMGILPKGSGNGLARHLGIPVNIKLALKCLFNSQVINMDTFRLNGKLSLNVSGIGFDGHIAELFGGAHQRGLRGYTRIILNEFIKFPEFEAKISIGENSFVRKIFVIAIANSSQYGNNARIAPAASVCDELIDLSILKKFPAYRLDFIYSFFSGTIDQSDYCETLRIRKAFIELNSPMSFHIDGEPTGKAKDFTVELIPGSLRMLAPLESAKV